MKTEYIIIASHDSGGDFILGITPNEAVARTLFMESVKAGEQNVRAYKGKQIGAVKEERPLTPDEIAVLGEEKRDQLRREGQARRGYLRTLSAKINAEKLRQARGDRAMRMACR
jgi:hypothetical protein